MDNMDYYKELTISLKTLKLLFSTLKRMFQIKTCLRTYISDLPPTQFHYLHFAHAQCWLHLKQHTEPEI